MAPIVTVMLVTPLRFIIAPLTSTVVVPAGTTGVNRDRVGDPDATLLAPKVNLLAATTVVLAAGVTLVPGLTPAPVAGHSEAPERVGTCDPITTSLLPVIATRLLFMISKAALASPAVEALSPRIITVAASNMNTRLVVRRDPVSTLTEPVGDFMFTEFSACDTSNSQDPLIRDTPASSDSSLKTSWLPLRSTRTHLCDTPSFSRSCTSSAGVELTPCALLCQPPK